MRVRFKHFESGTKSWQTMFEEAAAFATAVGPERMISISHSEDQNQGVVTVWYWGRDEEGDEGDPDRE